MRQFRIGLTAAVMAAIALPFVLAQVVEENLEVVIGKADDVKEQRRRAHKAHFEDRNFPAAIAAYEDLVDRFPDTEEASEALFRIANIHHWETVAPATAIPAYERLIEEYPDSDYAAEARVRIGQCHARMKEYDQAIAHCERLLDEHPDSRHVPFALLTHASIAYFDTQDRDTARERYTTLVTDHAGTPQAAEAGIWLTHMRPKRIIDPGNDDGPDVVPRSDPADELAKLAEYRATLAATDDYKTRATAQYMIAFSYFLSEDHRGAIREAQQLLIDYPDTYSDQLAQTHYLIGSMYERMRRYAWSGPQNLVQV